MNVLVASHMDINWKDSGSDVVFGMAIYCRHHDKRSVCHYNENASTYEMLNVSPYNVFFFIIATSKIFHSDTNHFLYEMKLC